VAFDGVGDADGDAGVGTRICPRAGEQSQRHEKSDYSQLMLPVHIDLPVKRALMACFYRLVFRPVKLV
jgi:hypothetical protein